MPISRLSMLLQGTGMTLFASASTFYVWTKHCHFVPLSPTTDPIFRSPYYAQYNPSANQTTHDLCVRKLPLFKLRPELVEDARDGGAKLVESFCAGVWGGFGMCSSSSCFYIYGEGMGLTRNAVYDIQRHYLSLKYRNTTTTSHQLWTRPALLESTYEPGTQITDHFEVLTKTPTSIIVRCGDSPLKREVRADDGLFEMEAEVNMEKGYAEFRLKSVFYQGMGKAEGPPMGPFMWWAHKMYTKGMMEGAVRNVKR